MLRHAAQVAAGRRRPATGMALPPWPVDGGTIVEATSGTTAVSYRSVRCKAVMTACNVASTSTRKPAWAGTATLPIWRAGTPGRSIRLAIWASAARRGAGSILSGGVIERPASAVLSCVSQVSRKRTLTSNQVRTIDGVNQVSICLRLRRLQRPLLARIFHADRWQRIGIQLFIEQSHSLGTRQSADGNASHGNTCIDAVGVPELPDRGHCDQCEDDQQTTTCRPDPAVYAAAAVQNAAD